MARASILAWLTVAAVAAAGCGNSDLLDHTPAPSTPIPFSSPVACDAVEPVACWLGDDNADEQVASHNGSFSGSVTFSPGIEADAFTFDGASAVEVPDDPAWTLGSADFTVELWVEFDSLAGGRLPFIAHDEGGGELNKWIFWYDEVGHDKLAGVPALRFHENSPHPGTVPSAHDAIAAPWSPAIGQWYYVVVTRTGSTFRLYLDGAKVATDSSADPIPDAAAPLTIGAAESFAFDGRIDRVAIHAGALSDTAIAATYAGVMAVQ